jgi:hypothetical protein
VDPAGKETKPTASQRIEERPILEQPPPQADAPFQLPQEFSSFAPSLAVNHKLGDSSRANLRCVSVGRRQTPQHRTTLPVTLLTRWKVNPTPSDRLLAALPPDVRRAFAPPIWNKSDLSHVAIRHWENMSKRERVGKYLLARKRNLRLQPNREEPTKHTPLSLILSQYLAEKRVSEEKALSKLHGVQTMQVLRQRGYSVDDVVIWSRILSCSDPDQVVLDFVAMADDLSTYGGSRLPTFLLMLILRTRSLKAPSLRLLLNYIWAHYAGRISESTSSAAPGMISLQTAMIMIVRLLRHARRAWPRGLEEIAALATKLIDREPEGILDLSHERIQGFSHLYNRLLSLLAQPASLRPIFSVTIQQRAQFCLVRKMTTFEPHLPVTREGFRALTKVQLAHKKTEAEREWARSKALSWPPWKEALLGIELDSEDLGRHSRAIDVLSRMTEAGYSHLQWEQTARVLAGWDTDASPTIQTRLLLKQPLILRSVDVKLATKRSKLYAHRVWAARILATRTVKEAWACFTSYEDSLAQTSILPYNAMFARLLHAGNVKFNRDAETTSVVPGDGNETWPEPTSPHDFLWVPSDPPSVDELFDRMTKRGLRPRKYLLGDLLDNAGTLAAGVKYINAGKLRTIEKDILLGNTGKNLEVIRAASNTIPDRVIAAFVRLLCRAPAEHEKSFALPKYPSPDEATPRETHTGDPFDYARNFVAAIRPSYRPIWYALFQGWKRRIFASQPQALHRPWLSFLSLLHEIDGLGIDLDFDGFRDIGEILEQIILTNRLFLAGRAPGFYGEGDPRLGCVSLCKGLFTAMAYGGSVRSKHRIAQATAWLPVDRPSTQEDQLRLIDVVNPAALHRTIRILGMGEDTASILTLLRWLHCFAPEFASVSDELANSRKLVRHALTAMRYFLEKSWRDKEFEHRAAARGEWEPGQKELLYEAKAIVEQHVEDWGGWPTDEELFVYHYINKRKAERLRRNASVEPRSQVSLVREPGNGPAH